MAKLFPNTLKINIEDSKLADQSYIDSIVKEINKITPKEILKSQTSLKGFIEKSLTLTKALEKANKNIEIENSIVNLFKVLINLRTVLTNEVYLLNVEIETDEGAKAIEAPIDDLFEKNALLFKNNQIEYNLSILQKQYKAIEIHSNLYNKLIKRIFRQSLSKTKSPFIYWHSDKTIDVGYFFDQHFAHYMTQKNSYLAHFFIKTKQPRDIYTKNTAKFYNRGHVYEWYIEDLNKYGFENTKEVEPIDFMERHEKDNIPFLQQGDITRVKKDIIEAVQIKRFNNTKLITCNQIESALRSLNNLTSSRLTREKTEKIIKSTFLSGSEKKELQKETADYIAKKSDILFENWRKIHNVDL